MKIIGIAVLVIFGLLLSALLLVLLVPVRYRFSCSYEEELSAEARISWLLHFLSVSAVYGQSFTVSVRLLGFPLKGRKKEETEYQEDWPDGEIKEADVAEELCGSRQREEGIEEKEEESAVKERRPEEETKDIPEFVPEQKEGGHGSRRGRKSFSAEGVFSKVKFRFQAFCAKVKEAEEKGKKIRIFLEDPANRRSFGHALRMVKHILPRKLSGTVEFGFEDPSVTGQAAALLSFAYACWGDALRITPVFDETVLKVQAKGRGRMVPGAVLFWCVRILMNKNIKRLIWGRRRKDGGERDGRE